MFFDVPFSSEGIIKWFSSVFLVSPTLGNRDIGGHTNAPWFAEFSVRLGFTGMHFQTGDFSACSHRRPHQYLQTTLSRHSQASDHTEVAKDRKLQHQAPMQCARHCQWKYSWPAAQYGQQRFDGVHIQTLASLATSLWPVEGTARWLQESIWRWNFFLKG